MDEHGALNERSFSPGEVIKLYGVYRCGCGVHEFFGVSGRRFPMQPCGLHAWHLVHRTREEKFF